MIFLAVEGGLWIGSYLVYAFWGIVSTNVGFHYRREYIKAILRQEASWYESFDIEEENKGYEMKLILNIKRTLYLDKDEEIDAGSTSSNLFLKIDQ